MKNINDSNTRNIPLRLVNVINSDIIFVFIFHQTNILQKPNVLIANCYLVVYLRMPIMYNTP